MHRIVVNVEAQIARRLWDEALEVEQLAREMADAGDPQAALFMERAEATKRAARLGVARATSLETGTHPTDLEPVRRVPLTDDEIAVREQISADLGWERLRDERRRLLAETDYLVQPDYPLADGEKAKWSAYRQKLRDLPAKTKDPAQVKWPEPPTTKEEGEP